MFRLLTRKKATARPKRVLLAWEFGVGRTHYANLLSVGAHLRASGVDCLAALYDTSAADREYAPLGIRTLQNFVWPSQRRWHPTWRGFPYNNFTDHLAHVGLNSAGAVTAVINHYDTLFSLYRPDLMLCEQSNGAMLAGRRVLPVVAMGFGVRLPPIVDGGFPLHPGETEPGYPVDRLLASINEGMTQAGRFPLFEIGDIMRLDAVMPFGPAEFDIYRDRRTTPSLTPNVPGVPEAIANMGAGGDEVFFYLHGFTQAHEAAMQALAGLGLPARAYIPDLSAESRARLEEAGVKIEPHSVPLSSIFRRSRVAVHHGGSQLVAACLAAGIPQVILCKEYDNRICGGFVAENGLGKSQWFYGIEARWITDAVHECYAEGPIRDRVKNEAPRYAAWFREDTSFVVAARICELLGVEPRRARPPA